MFGGLGMPELIVVLVIILIIFGAGKMPEIGSGIGKGIRNFKKAISSEEANSDHMETPEKEKEKK
ncbi:MAG: twin-arginine translocase TatA/TatE family subunit [Desulfosalsimonas sp.]